MNNKVFVVEEKIELLLSYLNNYIQKNKEIKLNKGVLDLIFTQGLDCLFVEYSTDNKNDIRHIILNNMIYFTEFSKLIRTFQEQNVTVLVLKGYSISRFYINPLSRRMCDFDLLVSESDLDKVKTILLSNGYNQVKEEDHHPMHLSYQKQQGVPVEIHTGLIHSLYLGERNTDNWYNDIWSNKQKVSIYNVDFFVMSNEDEIINQITHFANHFIYHGVQLKSLFEIALIIHSSENLRWDYIYHTLKELGFLEFGIFILSICKLCFFIEIPELLLNKEVQTQKDFVNDLISYYSKRVNDGVIEGWLRIISKYRFILKKPMLRPIAWCISLYCQFNANKLHSLLKNTIKDIKHINKKIFIIQKYGLISN